MKNWLLKLYHAFLKGLSKYLVTELKEFMFEEIYKRYKFEKWVSLNGEFIVRQRAISAMENQRRPSDEELYNRFSKTRISDRPTLDTIDLASNTEE